MFASLHNHTYTSNIRFLDSINRPEDMIDRAMSLGFSAMAFTDHESLSAAVSLLKEKDKLEKNGSNFKIIFGNEIYLIDESEIKNTNKYYHFILLAKDQIGWDQLRELSSRAWSRGYVERGQMRVPTTNQDLEEIVGKNPGHIIASTACLGGRLPNLILEHKVEQANAFVKWCISVFGADNFCLEIQPSDSDEQILVNNILIKFSKHYSIKYIITTDSHYLVKEDFGIHSAFLNSKKTSDRETEKFYKFTYIMSEQEMTEILAAGGMSLEDIEQGFKNTIEVANAISIYDFRQGTIVPTRQLPDFKLDGLFSQYYEQYPFIKLYAESDNKQDKYLLYQIEQGIKSKKITLDNVKLERINTELDVLKYISNNLHQELSAYLNLTVDIVNLAWQVSLVGCGRGSACGFYINYLIGITQADPLIYDLPYWRFLNKERVELPDVDEDFQPEKTEDIIQILREAYGDDNVLNCATFKTESLKSAILTCCRGMGINNDEAQAIAALVPSHRGKTYTLNDCLFGNEEQEYEPVEGFKQALDAYPGLFDAVKKIEGLPTNSSIHASALYIFNEGYLKQNSLMRAPNKTKMTAFNMHDSDDMGALKMDVLRTDAQSKMAKCLDLLLKDNQIEWQGSLRATYDKYIHPDVLNYDDLDMWEKAANGEIANLFQFETQVGSVCIKKARPTNVMQLAEINSIMRLAVEDGEQPIDKYVRFRNDINTWYLEMYEEGLNNDEVAILEKYLKDSFGISGSQEKLMLLVMDPGITGFTLGEANGFRKAIAKKIAAKIQENKEKYFAKGHALHTREVFLNYVWKNCVEPQLGYSFSLNHTLPYSIIAVQEMNLATRWNPLYWQCACLCVNAGNYVGEIGEEDDDDEVINVIEEENEEDSEEVKKEKSVAPNYGKIAKALSDAQKQGVNIELPDINESQIDFIPDTKNNSILYSLQAITVINKEMAEKIIAGRPYSSVLDFYSRIQPSKVQMIGLIKAGSFDKLVGKNRKYIMGSFFNYLADQEYPLKDKLTSAHLKKALELGLNLQNYQFEIKMYKYKKYISVNQYNNSAKRYELTDESCIKFFQLFIEDKLVLSKNEYSYIDNSVITVKPSAFDRVYKDAMEKLMTYLNSTDGREEFKKLEQKNFINELQDKYCHGSIADWEMETLSFYHESHPLIGVNGAIYQVKKFNDLPEEPVKKEINTSSGVKEVFDTCSIIGTVTNALNGKHIISVLTTDGVVDVKFYAASYNQYNQKLSRVDSSTKKKVVIDDSWFKRGNKVIIYGYRRENMFVARNIYTNGFPKMVGLIESISNNGEIKVRYSRSKN